MFGLITKPKKLAKVLISQKLSIVGLRGKFSNPPSKPPSDLDTLSYEILTKVKVVNLWGAERSPCSQHLVEYIYYNLFEKKTKNQYIINVFISGGVI